MSKQKLLIFDADGFLVDEEIVDAGHILAENELLVDVDADISFELIKLVDGKLVEGKSEDEFYMDELISSLLPDAKELEKAEFEIKILTLLSEMEVI